MVLFDSCTIEILVEESKKWIPLKDVTDLPYFVSPWLSYPRFHEFRAEQVAACLPNTGTWKVMAPPEGSPMGEALGGSQQPVIHHLFLSK